MLTNQKHGGLSVICRILPSLKLLNNSKTIKTNLIFPSATQPVLWVICKYVDVLQMYAHAGYKH